MKMGKWAALAAVLAVTACNNETTGGNQSGDTARGTDTSAQKDTATTSSQLEPVFEDSAYQFTGIAKAEGSSLLINYPRWSPKYKYGVVTANGNNNVSPYPDEATNTWQAGQPGDARWVCVQSVYYDDQGTLWVLDPSAPMLKTIQGGGAKLVRMDKATGKMAKTYLLKGTVADTAYANDVRIDTKNQYAYISESKGGGIIVIDLASGKMRQVLKGHYSVISDPAYKYIIDGRELMKEGKPAKFNSDGIGLTPDGEWVYYKPLTDDKLYRIKTEYLRNWSLTDKDIQAKVEDLGHFASTDGMIFDAAGNLYFGDPQHYRLIRIDKNLKMTTLVEDKRLSWPDSYAIADGYLYVTCSQIQNQPEYNNGVNKRTTPYSVYRLKL